MHYKKVSDSEVAVRHISDTIASHLDMGERVLWLIPGGSAIAIAAKVSKQLAGLETKNLHVTLTDERFGEVGHADSNWQQLIDAGFDLPGAQLTPVLTGANIEETAKLFAENLQIEIMKADFSIGLFGMGADGHTAGILPSSPAVTSSDWATHYRAYNYRRITMTPTAIARLDEAVLYAVGAEKLDALEKLQVDIALNEQPAQILKKVATFTVYNDHKGEEV